MASITLAFRHCIKGGTQEEKETVDALVLYASERFKNYHSGLKTDWNEDDEFVFEYSIPLKDAEGGLALVESLGFSIPKFLIPKDLPPAIHIAGTLVLLRGRVRIEAEHTDVVGVASALIKRFIRPLVIRFIGNLARERGVLITAE